MKIGAEPIISAMSALVIKWAATPNSRNGPTWPISDIAAICPQTLAERGQATRRMSAIAASASAATPARPQA